MHNLLKLVAGTLGAQLLAILASPLLTRLYSPEDFGLFSSITIIVYYLTTIAFFRLEVAILKNSDKVEFSNLLNSCHIILLINIVIFSIGLVLSILIFNLDLIYIYGVIPLVFFGALYNLYTRVQLLSSNINLVSKSKFSQGFWGTFGQLFLGILSFNTIGLVFGQLLGLIVGAKTLIKKIYNNHRFSIVIVPFDKYKNFYITDTMGSLANLTSNHAPLLLIIMLLGTKVGGLYYMASRILMLPISIISVSVSQYISSKFLDWKSKNILYINNERIINILLLLILYPFSIVFLYGDKIFGFIFGKDWEISGLIATYSCVWLAFKFIFDSHIVNLSLNNQNSTYFFLQFFLAVGRILSILLCVYFYNKPLQVILYYSVFSTIIYFIALSILLIKLKYRKIGKIFLLALMVISFIYLQINLSTFGLYSLILPTLTFFIWLYICLNKINILRGYIE